MQRRSIGPPAASICPAQHQRLDRELFQFEGERVFRIEMCGRCRRLPGGGLGAGDRFGAQALGEAGELAARPGLGAGGKSGRQQGRHQELAHHLGSPYSPRPAWR